MPSDHRALRALAERLERLLGALAADSRCAGEEVGPLLEELRCRLVAQLEAEETSGILERAASTEPRLARRVEQLRLEHHDLRHGAAVLGAGCDSGDDGRDWHGFYVRFAAFRSVLENHEQAENDVLHCAYLEDIGGG